SRRPGVRGNAVPPVAAHGGKLEDSVAAVHGGGPAPLCAAVVQGGLPQALWPAATRAPLVELLDRPGPKRRQGLTTGPDRAMAALHRALRPRRQHSRWHWFSPTVLRRDLPTAAAAARAAPGFGDPRGSVPPEAAAALWNDWLTTVREREPIDRASIGDDGPNCDPFLDPFHSRWGRAARGTNHQGRDPLRPVSSARFCAAAGPWPWCDDVDDGHRTDARQLAAVLPRFPRFFRDWSGRAGAVAETTLIFDTGTTAAAHCRWRDEWTLKVVGSVQ